MERQAEYDRSIQQNQGASSTGPVEPTARPSRPVPTPGAAPVTPDPHPEQQQQRTPSLLERISDTRNLARQPKQESPGWSAGPRPHKGSTRTSSNELRLPFTTGAPLLLMSMRNLTRHNSKKQQTTKQLQSKLHQDGFQIESTMTNIYQLIQLQSTGQNHQQNQ